MLTFLWMLRQLIDTARQAAGGEGEGRGEGGGRETGGRSLVSGCNKDETIS